MQDKVSLFIPGRLCLFGEHSDWAGFHRVINANIVPGIAIVTGIEQGIYADVEKSDKFIMHNISSELENIWVDFECPMQVDELRKSAAEDGYFSYVAGVASYVNENYHVGGLKITITKMDLPVKTGLSSSAAICVLVARAFNLLYELKLNTIGEMDIAYRGEQRTSSRCGRLDQACAFGVNPVVMKFDGSDIGIERLVIRKPLYWVFADLKAEKDTIRILSDLNKCYPFAENAIERSVHEALGVDNQIIVSKAIEFMRDGNAKALGKLMTEAQELFDEKVAPACPTELKAPALHRVLSDKKVKQLTYGGKGVGSQGDGSVQFLAKSKNDQEALFEYLNSIGLTAYQFTIKPRLNIHKAIIPVAGFGTRLYPATRTVKKEFIPVVDSDGLVKPVILILLEQLYDSGINEICLIVGSDEDIEIYKQFFNTPLSSEHYDKLPSQMQEYESKILEIGKTLTYRIQHEKYGFGHAIYQGRDFCGNEPLLLLLGDTIYRSNSSKTCTMQLLEAYEKLNTPIVSVHSIPLEHVVSYGVLSGLWEDKEERVLKVKSFVEKPGVEFAEDNMAVKCKNNKKAYFAVFGQYVLTPDVFDELEKNINTGKYETGTCEFGLTDAMAALIDKCGLYGVKIDGEMFDMGNAKAYLNAVGQFHRTES